MCSDKENIYRYMRWYIQSTEYIDIFLNLLSLIPSRNQKNLELKTTSYVVSQNHIFVSRNEGQQC